MTLWSRKLPSSSHSWVTVVVATGLGMKCSNMALSTSTAVSSPLIITTAVRHPG
eukprot:CAMPEP_0119532268 /NCGR_PEP_ID=MMETSP1344-20130328/45822_1 /TAXON_ID=236787 /ORGANISM="Florenciella parvula, Strain CCMP2471" /LENGTH=53 /DNA_ID=CAMNT_0007572737 /DNA_START=134 /DNA_END=292 /DNA_ORIENTATION=-